MLTSMICRQVGRAAAWGARSLASSPSPDPPPTEDYDPQDWQGTAVARGRGLDVLHDPVFNKGTGHPLVERERLGLRGLLPARVLSMKQQVRRVMERYESGHDYLTVEEEADSGVTHERLRRWHVLQEVQDRNETLFYRVLCDHFTEMAPIVYTPVVGHVCTYYHRFYRRPRGMTFSAADRGEMATMVWNWPSAEVDAVVVTDGSRILGLGDLGANGLGIPVGKLDLYCAAGGFNPSRVLPAVLDVGTDNAELRADPWYIGLRQPRLRGAEYYAVVDEFVAAVTSRWPRAVVQFEDFSLAHAQTLLNRYRDHHTVFNDDIQGTATTAVGGIYGALGVLGRGPEAIADQRFVVVGAGSAGMGVVDMLAAAMQRHGLSPEAAAERFHVLDSKGLVTATRTGLSPSVAPFARKDKALQDGAELLEVVETVRPTALIGLAGAGRLFTHGVLRAMGEINRHPIIFPMSNPTSRMECTHEEAQAATGGRAIFAAGSPQPDVTVAGRLCVASQANNLYIFPGLALGALLAHSGHVSDHMLMAAAEALPSQVTDEERARGACFPNLERIRDISLAVACEVIKAAAEEGRLGNPEAARALARGDDCLTHWVLGHMWKPEYKSLVAPSHATRMFNSTRGV